MDALFVAFLVSSTALISVGLGVLGAYYAISGVLAAFNPSRPSHFLAALVPNSKPGKRRLNRVSQNGPYLAREAATPVPSASDCSVLKFP